MIRKIVDAVPAKPEDKVVEIGPGDGALTKLLIGRYPNLTVIEIDSVMVNHLREEYPGLEILHSDFLKLPMEQLEAKAPVHIIGNLPYYVTSQILFRVLEYRHLFETATVMMQKEVARRIVSEPGTKEYGILSVQLQLMASVSYLFDVPPGVFSPPPKVDSAVIQLRFDRPALQCRDKSLKAVVRTVFNKRRKKISNALKDLPPVTHLGSSTHLGPSTHPSSSTPPDGSSHPGLSNQPGPSTHPDLSNQPDFFALLEARGFDLSKRAGDWTPAMYEKLAGTLEQLGIL